MKPEFARISLVVVGACAMVLLTLGVASAAGWVDEMSNSLIFYQATYPTSNFEPYHNKLMVVRNALGRGDEMAVRGEIGELFKMLRGRAYDINDVAADELMNYWQTLVPAEELKTEMPAVEDCKGTTTRLTCGSLTIDRIQDLRDYPPESQDNRGGSEGG